jgi:hypothetical protein
VTAAVTVTVLFIGVSIHALIVVVVNNRFADAGWSQFG